MATERKRAPGAGRPPKIKGFAAMTTRVPTELLDELRVHAALRGVSVSDLAREVLSTWCERQPDRQRLRRLTKRG